MRQAAPHLHRLQHSEEWQSLITLQMARLTQLQAALEVARELPRIHHLQGQIKEIRDFLGLTEEANRLLRERPA